MVLESIFNPFIVKKKPWEMFGAGFIYALVGLVLSYFVFREASGLLMVFLIVMAALPLLFTTIKNEEELDLGTSSEFTLLKEHSKVLLFMLFLFLGITVALAGAYVILPQKVVDTVFSMQEQAIMNVNSNIQGNVTHFFLFQKIFINNIKVLMFCILFSFLYGTGAIFILTWNASVVAVAIGNLFKSEIASVASYAGLSSISAYFSAASFSFFRYMTHGFLEVVAYLIAGIAGGIISIAIVRNNWQNEKVLIDAIDMILLSFGVLLIAGIVEVYVTPMIIS